MNVLADIFARTRMAVKESRREIPLAEIRREAEAAEPPRGFLRALRSTTKPIALIAEVKKASPSKGLIRANFDAEEISVTYEGSGASALSVLTDVPFFQGSAENLRRARAATTLPCLRKDFLEDPYQIYEARAWGADAVLLIAAALEEPVLRDLQDLARELGMDSLVEVHDEYEAERALKSGAELVGVNNRSLVDFSTDLATAERILPLLGGVFSVAESALSSHADVVRMQKAGAAGVLIGTTFCRAEDIGAKVREVMDW